MEHVQKDLLVDDDLYLERATTGQRFANYIIDVIVFYVLAIGGGIVIALLNPSLIDAIDESPGLDILDRLISLLLFGIYMGLIEGISKGKSLGKLITGTKAVNEDGSKISFSTGFMRGLSRSVPFEAFSAFGTPSHPWHDRWTDTYVIDVKNSRIPDNNL